MTRRVSSKQMFTRNTATYSRVTPVGRSRSGRPDLQNGRPLRMRAEPALSGNAKAQPRRSKTSSTRVLGLFLELVTRCICGHSMEDIPSSRDDELNQYGTRRGNIRWYDSLSSSGMNAASESKAPSTIMVMYDDYAYKSERIAAWLCSPGKSAKSRLVKGAILLGVRDVAIIRAHHHAVVMGVVPLAREGVWQTLGLETNRSPFVARHGDLKPHQRRAEIVSCIDTSTSVDLLQERRHSAVRAASSGRLMLLAPVGSLRGALPFSDRREWWPTTAVRVPVSCRRHAEAATPESLMGLRGGSQMLRHLRVGIDCRRLIASLGWRAAMRCLSSSQSGTVCMSMSSSVNTPRIFSWRVGPPIDIWDYLDNTRRHDAIFILAMRRLAGLYAARYWSMAARRSAAIAALSIARLPKADRNQAVCQAFVAAAGDLRDCHGQAKPVWLESVAKSGYARLPQDHPVAMVSKI